MSARLTQAEVRAALKDAPVSGATAGDLCCATGLRHQTVARVLARLVARKEVELIGVGYRLRAAEIGPFVRPDSAPQAPSLDHLRDRLMDVRAGKEDRSTIRRLLAGLKDPTAQRDAILLLARLEAK